MGVLQIIADIILIVAALFSLIAFAFLAYAAWLIIDLVKEIRGETKVVNQTARTTISEIRSTMHFISNSVVKPAAQAAGILATVRATAKALTEDVLRKQRTL